MILGLFDNLPSYNKAMENKPTSLKKIRYEFIVER
jgi:hypothetical protein